MILKRAPGVMECEERWRDGEMERWRDGEMERWRDGEMEYWSIGVEDWSSVVQKGSR
jgi:hypothetical protein